MTEITTQQVKDVLDEDEAKSVSEITIEIVGEGRCSECGRLNEDWKQSRDEVMEALKVLLERHQLTSTPDWKYRLARRR